VEGLYRDHHIIIDFSKVELKHIIHIIDSLRGKLRILLEKDSFYYILVIFDYNLKVPILKLDCWQINNQLMIIMQIKDFIFMNNQNLELIKLVVKYIINKLFDYKLIDEIKDEELWQTEDEIYFVTFIQLVDTEYFIRELEEFIGSDNKEN
jgi:hypothetical protein